MHAHRVIHHRFTFGLMFCAIGALIVSMRDGPRVKEVRMTENGFANCLKGVLAEGLDVNESFDPDGIRSVETFRDAGVLTTNAGLVVTMDDGAETGHDRPVPTRATRRRVGGRRASVRIEVVRKSPGIRVLTRVAGAHGSSLGSRSSLSSSPRAVAIDRISSRRALKYPLVIRTSRL